jgi:hypothetical protein
MQDVFADGVDSGGIILGMECFMTIDLSSAYLSLSFAVEKAVVRRKGPLPLGQCNSNCYSDQGMLTVPLQNRYLNLVLLMYVEFFLP